MLTLAEFLTDNGLSYWICVISLIYHPVENDLEPIYYQEIDKVVDEETLFSLLMPWELGTCLFVTGQR